MTNSSTFRFSELPMNYLLALFTFLALPAAAQQRLPFDLQAHRGGRGLMPENTIPAMRRALALGATTLEMDAAISQDKQVLLSHDPYLNADFVYRPDGRPLTVEEGKALKIYGLPYAEIRRYDVGSHGNPKFCGSKSCARTSRCWPRLSTRPRRMPGARTGPRPTITSKPKPRRRATTLTTPRRRNLCGCCWP